MRKRKTSGSSIFCYVIVAVFSLICIFPVWVALAVSVSEENDIVMNGFCLIPRTFTLDTYAFLILQKGRMLLKAFGVTLLVLVLGTVYTVLITTCYAYACAQNKDKFPFANALSFFAWFTTVFSGGILPWYILCTQYYGLRNNLLALFIPYGMNVFNMFILKNGFKNLPEELFEAARIDGASNLKIFVRISLPLSKVSLVTVGLFTVLAYWNDFTLPLYLISTSELCTVQKFLYNMMSNITALLSGVAKQAASEHMVIPANTAKMGMTILTVFPIAAIFPFANKYFVKGITIGAVKG